jgi:hypothetical protein
MANNYLKLEINNFFKNIGLNRNLITNLAYPNIILLTIETIYKNLSYDYNT